MDDGFWVIILMFYIIFMGLLFTGALFESKEDDTGLTNYQKNVCSYEGGAVKDDVCIVDGKVFEIPAS